MLWLKSLVSRRLKNVDIIYIMLFWYLTFLPILDLEFKNPVLSFFKHVWLLKLEGCHVDSYLCINLPSATFSGNQQLNFQPYSLPLFDKAQWLVLLVFLVAIFQAIFKWSLLFHKHHRSQDWRLCVCDSTYIRLLRLV